MISRLLGRWRPAAMDLQAAVGGHWEEVGRLQFDFLIDWGLRPSDRLLDMPCGSFRLGRLLIPWLEEGNYLGVDGDAELMRRARKEVLSPPMLARRPGIEARKMPAPLPDADVAWIHALFDHITPDATAQTLRYARIAAPVVLATFFLVEDPTKPARWPRKSGEAGAVVTYPDREYWHHSREWVENAATDAGLRVHGYHDGYAHPLGLTIVEMRR